MITEISNLPKAVEIERAIIAILLMENEHFDEVYTILHTSDMFYDDIHKNIYNAMIDIMRSGSKIDVMTVANNLKGKQLPEDIYGFFALIQITDTVTSSSHIIAHSMIVREKWERRELSNVYYEARNKCFNDDYDTDDIVMSTDKQTSEIIVNDTIASSINMGQGIKMVIDDIEKMQNNKSVLTGLDTGLKDLNKITNGWQNTDLIIIGARSGMGKTAFALNLAINASSTLLVDKAAVGIFSLEMGKKQILQRLLSIVTETELEKIKNANFSIGELDTFIKKAQKSGNLPIWIDDRAGLSISAIKSKAKQWKKKNNIGLLIVDYLQLMKGTNKQSREQEIAEISRSLKELAKNLDIPIIALSQLNRDVEKRATKEPQLSDLRESGAIEQDADLIVFLYHQDVEGGQIQNRLKIAKHRNGMCDNLEVKFIPSTQKWVDKDYTTQMETFKPYAGFQDVRSILPREKDFEDTPF